MVDALEWAWVRRQVLEPDAAVRPPRARLDAAVPDAARRPPPRGRGTRRSPQGAWGRPGQVVRRTAPPVPRPRALGVVPASPSDETRRPARASSSRSPTPPATVSLLSGDVHCSYTAGATAARPSITPATAIHQLTMSPFRNDIQRAAKLANRLFRRQRPSRRDPPPLRIGRRRRRRTSRGSSTRVPGSPMASCRSSSTAPRHGRSSSTPTSRDGDRQELERTLELELSPTG